MVSFWHYGLFALSGSCCSIFSPFWEATRSVFLIPWTRVTNPRKCTRRGSGVNLHSFRQLKCDPFGRAAGQKAKKKKGKQVGKDWMHSPGCVMRMCVVRLPALIFAVQAEKNNPKAHTFSGGTRSVWATAMGGA